MPGRTTTTTTPEREALRVTTSSADAAPRATARVQRHVVAAIAALSVIIFAVVGLTASDGPERTSASDTTRSDTASDDTDDAASDTADVPQASTRLAEPTADRFSDWKEHRDQYFFAALPSDWSVTGATANGIDISPPDGTGTASFAYVKGSVAGANAYGTPTDNEGFAGWILNMQGAQNVSMGSSDPLGTYTDAVGLSWTFDGREFDATANGEQVHGVLQVGTATDAFGSWVGMAWERVARADRWDALKDDLAAVARSITIIQTQSSGGSIRMPAQDADTGEVSATQDDVESRLSQQQEDATMGGQSLTDPTTGDRYWAPFSAYDESRGGYFIDKSSGSQQLDPDY